MGYKSKLRTKQDISNFPNPPTEGQIHLDPATGKHYSYSKHQWRWIKPSTVYRIMGSGHLEAATDIKFKSPKGFPDKPVEGEIYFNNLRHVYYKFSKGKWKRTKAPIEENVKSFFEDVNSDVAGEAAEQIAEAEDQRIVKEIITLVDDIETVGEPTTVPFVDDKLGVGQNRLSDKPVSRFRKRFRTLTDAELKWHDAIKDTAAKLEALINPLCGSNYREYAMKALEEVVFWSVKDLTGNEQYHLDDAIIKIVRKAARTNAS